MIYLFTVACSEPASTAWWAELFETDRSSCFDRLTSLLEPEATHPARFEWLDSLAAGGDGELAQRHAVLRGFPDYFERHWERAREGPFHIGNADHAVGPLLPGLWLLWPDMRFLFSYRDGVGAVDAEAVAAGGTDEAFERACRDWAARVAQLRSHQTWLVERGARVEETRLEVLATRPDELERIWKALPGEWNEYRDDKLPFLAQLAAEVEADAAACAAWPEERRLTFESVCREARGLLHPHPATQGRLLGRVGLRRRGRR